MEQVINNFVINLNSIGRGFCDYAGNMFVQSSVLIILILIIDFLLRKRTRAVFRYCIWMLVFVKLILPPTLSSPTGIGYWSGDFISTSRLASKPISDMSDAESVKPIIPEEAEISAIPLQTEPVQPIFKAPTSATIAISNLPSLTWQAIVFLIWLVGVLIFSSLLIQRLFFVRSLLLQSKPAQGRLFDTLNQCLQQVGIRHSIELRLSSNLQSPAVCGLVKPVILIPTSLLEKLSRDKLRAVLIHELAHIKRGDLWVNLIQTLLQIIYFYNPFVWLANIVVRRIREQAVDEAVLVALGNEAESYSNTLIDIAEMVFWKANFSLRLIGVAESKNALHRRIKHILSRPIPKSAKLGILGLLVVAILAVVLLPMAKASSGQPGFLIKGTVVDAETERPIAGAKVGDVEHYAGGEQWTVTDSNGAYNYLTWYEEHGIKCEAADYKTQHKGLYTKLIGSEKEKVIDFALESERNTEEVDYSSVVVKEGRGFEDIIVGDMNCTGEFIKSKLGEPDKEVKNEKDWWLNYRKTTGLGFWVNPQENVLIEIRLNEKFKGRLTSGISMLSTKQDVFDVYGEPIRQEVAEDFDERFDNQVLLFRKSSWLRKPHIAKIHYDEHGLLFWFDGDNLNQIVVSRSENTQECDERKYAATLSNGVTVELVGICEHPSEGKQWWGPDGSRLDMSIITEDKSQYTSDYPGYEIAFKVDGKDFNFKRGSIKGSKESSGLDVIEPEGIIACRVHIKPGIKKTKITAGAASGQWSTIAKHNGQGITSKTFEAKKIILSAANESKEGLVMTITDNICFAEAIRLIAIDKNDSTFTGNMQTGLSDSGLAQSTFIFANLSLNSIKEFQFQIRPYEYVTFKNISLQPNFKTDVQVEVGKEDTASIGAIDVAIENFKLESYPEGGLHSVVVSIRNKGSKTSSEFGVYFYRGDPDKVKPMTHGAGPIKPGDIWNECSMPFALKEGVNEIVVAIDPENAIAESNETNNQALMTIVIKDGKIVEKSVKLESITTKDAKVGKLRAYEVNRNVADFPEKEDFSSPEAAYATINQISASGDLSGWQRVSVKRLADQLAKEKSKGKMSVNKDWAKVLLNAQILEVRIWNDNYAMVAAKLPQEFSSKPIRSPIDVRYLGFENGRWLNAGNDRFDAIEQAWAKFSRIGGRTKEQRIIDEKLEGALEHPEEIKEAAKQLFDKIHNADYEHILSYYSNGKWEKDGWPKFPTEGYYMVHTDYPGFARWCCETFKDNPIVSVELGEVFIGDKEIIGKKGWPTVPYKLTLKDSTILEGNLPFEYNFDGVEGHWHGMEGIDWHLQK